MLVVLLHKLSTSQLFVSTTPRVFVSINAITGYYHDQFDIRWIWATPLFEILGGGQVILYSIVYTYLAESVDPKELYSPAPKLKVLLTTSQQQRTLQILRHPTPLGLPLHDIQLLDATDKRMDPLSLRNLRLDTSHPCNTPLPLLAIHAPRSREAAKFKFIDLWRPIVRFCVF
jgi:hypothetical protein